MIFANINPLTIGWTRIGLDNAEVDNRRIAKSDIQVTKLIRVAAGEWSNKKSLLLEETQRIESIIRLKMQKDGMRKESKS